MGWSVKGHPHPQRLAEGTENANLAGCLTKPRAGRRRWGHGEGTLKADDWADYQETEALSAGALCRTKLANEKRRPGDEAPGRCGPLVVLARTCCCCWPLA